MSAAVTVPAIEPPGAAWATGVAGNPQHPQTIAAMSAPFPHLERTHEIKATKDRAPGLESGAVRR